MIPCLSKEIHLIEERLLHESFQSVPLAAGLGASETMLIFACAPDIKCSHSWQIPIGRPSLCQILKGHVCWAAHGQGWAGPRGPSGIDVPPSSGRTTKVYASALIVIQWQCALPLQLKHFHQWHSLRKVQKHSSQTCPRCCQGAGLSQAFSANQSGKRKAGDICLSVDCLANSFSIRQSTRLGPDVTFAQDSC